MSPNQKALRLLAISLTFLVNTTVFAQEGNFLLTHHIPRTLGLDHANFDIVYDQQGLLNVANRQGILRYDGHRWDLIYTPMAVFALAEAPDGTLYAAGEGDFGKVGYTESGELLYQSLRSETSPIPKAWFDVVAFEDRVYFLSLDEVLVFDPTNPNDGVQPLTEDTYYYRAMFAEPNRLLVTTEGSDLLTVDASGQVQLDSVGILPDSVGKLAIVAAHPYNGKTIYGTHEALWVAEADSLTPACPEADSLLHDSWILSAQWVQDTLLAVGTLNQGVLFINPTRGTVVQHINYHTGLPDNEVLAMRVDADMGVWVAHEFGFSRISPFLPIRSFAHFPGLEGNLLAVKRHQEQLYVATSLGVFYLDQVRNYRETVYYVRKRTAPVPTRTRSAPVQQQAPPSQPNEEDQTPEEQEKGGFFTNLFSRQAREERQEKREEQRQARQEEREQQKAEQDGFFDRLFSKDQEDPNAQPEINWERRIRRELLSIRYVFKKVEGLDAKCKQLVTFDNRLLVGSHSGVYEIEDGHALLISNQPVQYLYPSASHNRLIFSTLYDEVHTLEPRGELWLEGDLGREILEPVIHMNEDDQYLWLVSPDHVLRYNWSDSTDAFKTYPIRNPNYEPLFAINYEGTMHFVNGEGFHQWDANLDSVVIDESMRERYGVPQEYHFANPNRMWVYNGRKWHDISAKEEDSVYLDYLLLFDQVQHLSIDDESGHLWVTTPEEEMYQYDYRNPPIWSEVHELVLKEVRGQGGGWLPRQDFVISKENSFVSFEFTRPDFLGKLGIEYRYKLSGLNTNWSGWSEQNTITFNFLPPGDYTLEVQARDAFGNTNEPYSVAFGVVPPWWERGWFYALEVGIFGSLLLISFRLNRTKMRRTLASRVLTYLTLIMVIEFLQNLTKTQLTLGGNPIAEFGIEAAIAFALLPLEGLLRKFMKLAQAE